MAKQTINIGAAPNDRTGDTLRTAFDKVNDNFDELYAAGVGGALQVADLVTNLTTDDQTKPAAANTVYDLKIALDALTLSGGYPAIINDLTTGGTTNGLSAQQGVVLKGITDTLAAADVALDARTDALEAVVVPILRPEAYGAVGDGTTDDTAAFLLCAAACVTAKAKMVLAGKSYVISNTIPLDSGSSTFIGYPVEGAGIDATRILFKPAAISTPCFKMTGGSGNSSNKSVRNLTIERFDGSYSGLGIGIQIQNQCFGVAEDVHIEGLAVGVEIVNSGSGGFSEFNRLNRVRLLDNTRGIQFHRRSSGDASFHGNAFHEVQINVPANGYGLYLNGSSIGGTATSGQAFIYNCCFNLKIFGGTGTRYAIYSDNVNTEGNTGNVQCEATLTIDGNNGVFAVDGLLYSISTINKGAGAANIRFSRFSTGKSLQTTFSAFSDPSLTAFSPHPMGNLQSLERVNTVGPAIFPMRGSDRESIGMAFYNGSSANGLYLLTGGFGSTNPSSLTPGMKLQHDGGVITSYATKFVLQENGVSDQLVLDDGRVGGKLGRLPPVTSVSANAGVPQAITLWTNATATRSSEFYLCIQSTTGPGTSYDRRIRGMFMAKVGSTGRVVIYDEYSFTDSTAGAVSASPTFAVDSAGALILTITTDRALTLSGWELSGGTVLTV